MKSILIIGLGHFGIHLATKMSELNNEIMVVDIRSEIIDALASNFADAQIGDSTNPDFLKSLGVDSFDVCFVTVGENFQVSLETTALLKEFGAKHVVSKAQSAIQAKFLLRNGADEVVYPELDVAEKLAIKYSARNLFDYIELTDEYAICEIPVPEKWLGRSIIELQVRNKYGLNVLALKSGERLIPQISPDYKFMSVSDHVIVMGKTQSIFKISENS